MNGARSAGLERTHELSGPELAHTVLSRPPRHSGTDAMRASGSSLHSRDTRHRQTTSVRTSEEAAAHVEAQRMRSFSRYVLVLVAVIVPAIAIIGGDGQAIAVHGLGLAVAAISSIAVLALVHDAGDYHPWQGFAFGLCMLFAVATGLYYWGPLSAALLVVPLGVLLLCLGRSARQTRTLVWLYACVHLSLGAATAVGVVPAVGVLSPAGLSVAAQLVLLVCVQVILAATYLLARAMLRSTHDTYAALEEAARELAQRDALLAEAAEELRQRIGVAGRYTQQQIGSYRLGVVMGVGAMGEVYDACHRDTGEPAAVKVMHPRAIADPERHRRFLREIRTLAALNEPNVVKVLELPSASDPFPYLAMERLHGASLAQVLRERSVMPLGEVVEMVAQIARGLGAIHAAGIVHRDLAPKNIFRAVDEHGAVTWKILDFGVAKLTGSDTLSAAEGRAIGTPSYMAPEQARGRAVDARADVYALGVIVYRALTGRPAFAGSEIAAVLHDVVYEMPVRPRDVRPMRRQLEYVLALAIAKDPALRFGDAGSLGEALHAAGHGRLPVELRRRARALLRAQPWRDLEAVQRTPSDSATPPQPGRAEDGVPCAVASTVASRPIRATVTVSPPCA